jgi:glycerol-3-phosphate dehydrogenase (NAD(P)+)
MSTRSIKIAVIGAGTWGSSLAQLAAKTGHDVSAWSRQSEHSLASTLAGANLIISAVAMRGVPSIVQQVQACAIAPDATILTATKGLTLAPEYPEQKAIQPALALPAICTPSQIWQVAFPKHSIVVLSGPNLSQEIQQGLPAATVVAGVDADAAKVAQSVFSSSMFRVYTNSDPLGVELGGTLKNVIAIAAGACDGLQLGTNAKAALVTRGLAEMIRIGNYWGAKVETFYGLAGLGDLLATCNSPLSRNYQVGYRLAQGETLVSILDTLKGTVEGINTSQVLMQLTHEPDVIVPISYQVARLLDQEITPTAAVTALMLRDVKSE